MVHPKRLLFAEEDARINDRLGSRNQRVVFRAAVDAQLEQRRRLAPRCIWEQAIQSEAILL
jgi:hypothetical protein